MSVLDLPLTRLDGTAATLGEITAGRAALLVNVASRCGLTPQYTGLEALQERFGPRGFVVVGLPCNQFGGQEPGTSTEIAEFCSATYGVTFPMTEKIEVNGPGRHPLYDELVTAVDEAGTSGDIAWNFEKFVLTADGAVVARFGPAVEPDDPRLVAAIESCLPPITDPAPPTPSVPAGHPHGLAPYEWTASTAGVYVARDGNRVAVFSGERGEELSAQLEQVDEAEAQRLIAEAVDEQAGEPDPAR